MAAPLYIATGPGIEGKRRAAERVKFGVLLLLTSRFFSFGLGRFVRKATVECKSGHSLRGLGEEPFVTWQKF
jgi:hypothetical protein